VEARTRAILVNMMSNRHCWDRVRLWEVPALLLVLALLSPRPAGAGPAEAIEAGLDSILMGVVSDGRVDYAALKGDPAPLDRWSDAVGSLSWNEIRDWPRESQIALYLNAYNARVLTVVRDAYPIVGPDSLYPAASIRQIAGVWESPFRVAGQNTSLKGVERDILWVDFHEPAMHFGLVPASLGAPKLRAEAFHGAKLGFELQAAVIAFLQDTTKVKIDPAVGLVRLSPIFDQYRGDFMRIPFVAPNLRTTHRDLAGSLTYIAAALVTGPNQKYLLTGTYKVEFGSYDWGLNDRSGAGK
jgi:hypothetical protein